MCVAVVEVEVSNCTFVSDQIGEQDLGSHSATTTSIKTGLVYAISHTILGVRFFNVMYKQKGASFFSIPSCPPHPTPHATSPAILEYPNFLELLLGVGGIAEER